MKTFIETLCVLILNTSLIWNLWDDRNGNTHIKSDDWILRGLLILVSSIVVWFIGYYWGLHDHNFWQALFLSFAMFAAFFPYLINIIHYKRGVTTDKKWWSHLSDRAIPDKLDMWRATPWYARMIIYLIILGAAVKLYICWDTLKAWNGCL